MLTLEGIGKRFGTRWIFRRLSMHVAEGQVLAVVGSNGSGKSTLLKIVMGVTPPTEGHVAVLGSLGYSALDLHLYPGLTARQHVDFVANMRGFTAVQPETILESVGLIDFAAAAVGTFSTGMRARLKLALAQIGDPSVLVLDEPSAALDSSGRDLVESIVARQQSRGAVLMATNDPEDLGLATHELVLA